MSDKKIQMTQRNATNDGWDNLYPKTTGDQVVAADGVTTFETHLANDVNHVPYAVATGVANTYAVTLNPAPTTYVDGMAVCVKINVASTGASTLNVNGLGAKTILDSLGNAITSGGLKANTPYTMRYNGTSFIVQGKGGGGNVTADKILNGYTATVDSGPIIGTMINKVGSGTVYTVSTSDQAISQGFYDGTTGSAKVKGEANLLASNIKNGVTIGAVTGNVTITSLGGLQKAIGTATITSDMITVVNGSEKYISIPLSLSFTPKIFIFYPTANSNLNLYRKIHFIDYSALGLSLSTTPTIWVDEGISGSSLHSWSAETGTYNMFFPPTATLAKVPYSDSYGQYPTSCSWIAIG